MNRLLEDSVDGCAAFVLADDEDLTNRGDVGRGLEDARGSSRVRQHEGGVDVSGPQADVRCGGAIDEK